MTFRVFVHAPSFAVALPTRTTTRRLVRDETRWFRRNGSSLHRHSSCHLPVSSLATRSDICLGVLSNESSQRRAHRRRGRGALLASPRTTFRPPVTHFSTKNTTSFSNADTVKDDKEESIVVTSKDEASALDSNNNTQNHSQDLSVLGRLVNFAQPEHALIYSSALTLLVTSSVTLILPTASGRVLDMVMSGDPSVSPGLVAAGLFGLTALAGTGVYARTLWLQQAGNTLVARLKQQLYRAILRQEVAYLEQVKTGDFMTRLSQDTTLIQSAVTTQAVAALRAIVMSTGSAIMLFQTSTTLALVSLGTLPPLFLSARYVGQILREKQRLVQTLHSQSSSMAEEALNGIATVKQFGGELQEANRYGKGVEEAHAQAISTGQTQALFDAAVHVGANGAILCVLGYGGSMVMAGTISAGDLTGFLMYSLLLAGNVSSLSGTYAEVIKALAAADRVWEIIDRQPAIPFGSESPSFDNNSDATPQSLFHRQHPMSVEFRNVKFAYPARKEETILGPNFSLHVQPGELLALVGESGSGKSTLASLLTRLYDIDNEDDGEAKGAILIQGKDIRDWDPRELRQRVVGIVSQEPWLMDGTIEENIRYSRPSATDAEVLEAAEHANVMSFARQFPHGLQTKVGPRGTQLSGGQKQRVAIARLILKDPPIIVLDEGTESVRVIPRVGPSCSCVGTIWTLTFC